jgi:hypothetical protein
MHQHGNLTSDTLCSRITVKSSANTFLDMKRTPTLQMGINKMIQAYVINEPFMMRFPNRSIWENGFQPNRNEGLIWYMDVFKTNEGITGARV